MNYGNLAQKTNYTLGSHKLDLGPIYLQSVNIPGINFSHIETSTRSGARLTVTGDTLTFNNLSFEMLIDEDFKVYFEFMDKVFKNVNPENGTFASQEFDLWLQFHNNKGNPLFKLNFYNCRIETISDISLDNMSDEVVNTLAVDIKYDYFKPDTTQEKLQKDFT